MSLRKVYSKVNFVSAFASCCCQ